MKVAVGFRNGIGNYVIFSSVISALADWSKQKVDVVISEEWQGESAQAVRDFLQNTPFIRLVDYPSQFIQEDYDIVYISNHTVISDPFYVYLNGMKRPRMNQLSAWAENFMHERDYYFSEIFKKFDYRGKLFPQFIPVAKKLPFKLSKKKKFVFSNGWARGSRDFWKRKSWPYWKELIEAMRGFCGDVEIHLVGNKDDRDWSTGLNAIDHCGDLTILETARLIKECDFGIYTDTATFHIADALNTKGVVLFGATLVSKNGPLSDTIIPISSSLDCAPCQGYVHHLHCSDFRCMGEISVGQVMKEVRRMI
jgi:hypothetical protein